MKKIVVFLVLIFSVLISNSQVLKKFSLIETEFFEQLDAFFTASGSSDQLKDVLKEFKISWTSYNSDKKEEIIKTCNEYLNKRAKPAPHYLNYFKALIEFSKKQHPEESYKKWNEGLKYTIKEENIRLADEFCNTTSHLLSENYVYNSPATSWKAQGAIFTFDFDVKPFVKFENVTLICFAKNDSIYITNTNGILEPLQNHWIGNKGRVNWKRSGYGENSVYADLSNYKIDLKKSTYQADSVTFLNKTYYDKTIFGTLEDKVINFTDPESLSYPRFDSYDKIFTIKDIYPNIDYKGGFSMHGAKFIGSGSKEGMAYLTFYRHDSVFVKTKSDFYIFRKDHITSINSAVSLYIKKDSIYHPGLRLKYIVKDNELLLIRDKDPQNMSRSPYYDTYHKVDMDFEQLSWDIENDELKMGTLKGSIVSKASFESANYFQEIRYNELGWEDQLHPLVALRRYSQKYNTEEFTAEAFSDFLKQSITQVRQLCMRLSYSGIIDYNIVTEEIKIKQRLYDYLNARVGKIDYDVIRFQSEHDMIGLENAALDLNTFDLKLYGVMRIQVSDSQNVVFYPRGRQLTLQEDRNFLFDGIIEAGLFEFYGQDFNFNYKDFKIKLESIDSMKIKVMSFDTNSYGMKSLVNIQNVIENITGDLLIDDPNNKSSVKYFPQYPIFNSKESSYVFYDYYSTQNGVYNRDKFYFAVDPYSVDSLNGFTTEGLKFAGEFISADILPVFREELSVQKDYSLGFTRITPPEGYPIYKGKATFYDTINLSNVALRGYGRINYLNSKAHSSDGFYLLPDSMNAKVDDYEIFAQTSAQGAEFPHVQAKNVQVHWEPYNDIWESTQLDKPIIMYDGYATLEGTTVFTPKGLHGKGKFQFDEAILYSESYTFKNQEVLADTSDFDLISDTVNKSNFAFKTKNVKTYVSFLDRKATFTSNDKVTVVQFPQNKYICYLDKFTWDMDTKEISLGSDIVNTAIPGETEAGAHFISVHPKQDTLNFVAPVATYDLKKYIIAARDVKQIDVADSRVFPGEEGKVTIYQDAKMETLNDAKILAERKNKYHNLYNATLNIRGRMEYSGSGRYDYVDETGGKQTIMMSLINVDSTFQTYATGAIPKSDTFALSPDYEFQGKVRLNASKPYLLFEGAANLHHECNLMKTYWFNFKDEINPNDIYIPISDEQKNIDNKRIFNGIFMAYDSTHIYSSFLSDRKSVRDSTIISANGYLHYVKNQKKYYIAPRKKLDDELMPGNLLTFHREFCLMYGEGKLNLGYDFGQVKFNTVGSISHNIPKGSVRIETMAFLDFFFPQELLKGIADTLEKMVTLPPVDLTRKIYVKNLNQVLGETKGQEQISDIQLYGGMKKLPAEFNHAFVFNELNMVWSQTSKSYKSVGKIGIQNIYDKQLNKLVDGCIELKKRKSGDELYIYLELSKRNWYFFNYSREIMQACSSDDNFDLFIEEMKDKDKELKTGRKDAKYSFYLSSDTKKSIFVRQFYNEEEFVETNTVVDTNVVDSLNRVNDTLLINNIQNVDSSDVQIKNNETINNNVNQTDSENNSPENNSPENNSNENNQEGQKVREFKLPENEDSKDDKKYKSKTGF